MKVEHTILNDKYIIEVTPKDRVEADKVRRFIEWVELNAVQPKNEKERD